MKSWSEATTRAAALTVALTAAFGWTVPAQANPADFSAEDRATIQQVETYLNGMRTLDSRFVQHNSDGSVAEGHIYLRRPGRLRIEYDPPVPVMLIANPTWLIHVDHELKSTNYLPLQRTPAYFLVRDRFSLDDGLEVVSVERRPGAVRVHVIETRERDAGSVILTFSENPFEFRQWRVIDAVGDEVQLTLVNPKFGAQIDPIVFNFIDPYHDMSQPN